MYFRSTKRTLLASERPSERATWPVGVATAEILLSVGGYSAMGLLS